MMKKERNYGLDMLRMICMFLIVNLHVLSPGGAMARVQGNEGTYYACWFLETCAYCAVDCYGIFVRIRRYYWQASSCTASGAVAECLFLFRRNYTSLLDCRA